MARNTIALISTYSHPSRDSFENMLRATFPEYRVQNIWLRDVIKQHYDWVLPNLWSLATEYGKEIILQRSNTRRRYFHTTYLFRKIRKAMRTIIDLDRHVFSVQTQSMYNTSVPGVPHFIFTDHTHLSNTLSPFFDRRMMRPREWIDLERTIYQNATCVFTRSSDVTADIVNLYDIPPGKVVCVGSGCNIPVPSSARLDNSRYAARHILFVGRDWERKGGPELAEAFASVLDVLPDAQLTIAGTRPTLDLPNCNVLGQLPLDELAQWYAKPSVFCMPTRLEPFGSVLLEAMMYRLPIVATAVGPVPDLVKEGITGHLLRPGDNRGLVRSLIGLLGDPHRCRRYGEAGYRHAVENYTWKRVGQRIRDHVRPIIAARATPSGEAVLPPAAG